MKESKLLTCLNTMDNKSLLDFGRYVKTPYHNRDEKLVALFDFYKKNRKTILSGDFPESKLEKAYVFKKICPKETYSPRKMRDILSDLTLIWEDYVVSKKIKSDKNKREELLLEYYQETKCEKYLFQSMHRQLKELENLEHGDSEGFLRKFRLNKRLYDTPFTLKLSNASIILGNVVEDLDLFYLIRKLHYSLEILNRRRLMQDKSVSYFLPDQFLKDLETSQYWKNNVVRCYVYGIRLMSNWDEEAYFNFKEDFFENKKQISKDIHGVVYVMMVNFILSNRYSKAFDYVDECMIMFENGFEEGVFEEDGVLPHNYFMNAISIAVLKTEKLDWVDYAIQTYATKINKRFREDMVNFARAYLYFARNEFEKVIEVLSGITYEEPAYKLRLKVILLRTYLELHLQGKDYPVFSACESFRLILHREKTFSASVKAPYYNLINYVKKIVQYGGIAFDKSGLIAEIKNEPQLVYKQWLVEKIQVSF